MVLFIWHRTYYLFGVITSSQNIMICFYILVFFKQKGATSVAPLLSFLVFFHFFDLLFWQGIMSSPLGLY